MDGRVDILRNWLLTEHALDTPLGDSAARTWQRVVALRHGARDSAVRRLLVIADALAVTAALALALLVISHRPAGFAWSLVVLPSWIVVFKAYGLYDRDLKRMSHRTVDDLPWIFHAVLIGSLLLLIAYRFLPVGGVWLGPLGVFAVLAICLVTALRALARRAAVAVLGPEPVVLVGDGKEMSALQRKLAPSHGHGVKSVGLISAPDPGTDGASSSPAQVVQDLDALVGPTRAERVVVAREDFDGPALFELLGRARELGLKVSVLPQLFEAMGPSVEIDDIAGVTVLGINPPVLPRSSRFLKRGMDIVGAAAVLLLTAPLLALCAVAIKLDSRGPVFFRQERIGKWGRHFRLVKFRTMSADAEERRDALLAASRDPGWLHLEHDPRITRVGRLLREWSLDELPQMWNVLKGEMSLVGPRPIIPSEDSQLEGWRRSRIDLSPGITGLWQVLGRTSIPFDEMIRLDYVYVTSWSLWTDVRLLLRTVPAVLLRRGVN
jgi:exopolysaccharide biosynthesis polyprenyl glycosylphosphotransferase